MGRQGRRRRKPVGPRGLVLVGVAPAGKPSTTSQSQVPRPGPPRQAQACRGFFVPSRAGAARGRGRGGPWRQRGRAPLGHPGCGPRHAGRRARTPRRDALSALQGAVAGPPGQVGACWAGRQGRPVGDSSLVRASAEWGWPARAGGPASPVLVEGCPCGKPSPTSHHPLPSGRTCRRAQARRLHVRAVRVAPLARAHDLSRRA